MAYLDIRSLLIKDPNMSYLTLPIDEASKTILFLNSMAMCVAKKIVKSSVPGRRIAEFTGGLWREIPDSEVIDLDNKFVESISNLFLISYGGDVLFYIDYNDELVIGICKDKIQIEFIENIICSAVDESIVLSDFNKLIDVTSGAYKDFAIELKNKNIFSNG